MVTPSQWDKIIPLIDNAEKIILTTHFNPDGDAIGSEIALASYLHQRNKQVWIINTSPTIYNYKFLDPDNRIIVFNPEKHHHLIQDADLVLIVDISDWERLDKLGEQIRQSHAHTVCIDHHRVEKKFAEIDIICEQASSTGELIFEFLQYVKCDIRGEIASALYTCILTDTGSFRFSNTTALTHEIAAQLRQAGVNARAIYEKVYENNSRSKMALLGKVLNGLHYECNGKLAWFLLTQQMLKETNAEIWDTEGFTEMPRSIEGVEVSLMISELDDNKVKMSLRSKGNIVINDIAMKFGGGGHNFAAGAVLKMPIATVLPLILNEVKSVIDRHFTAK